MIIAILILVALASDCKAVRDTVQFHYGVSIFRRCKNIQFWNPDISWKNKYKEGEIGKPRFWGSTTIFVWLTDAWHLFDFLGILFMFIAMLLMSCAELGVGISILVVFCSFVLYFGLFELNFRLLTKI